MVMYLFYIFVDVFFKVYMLFKFDLFYKGYRSYQFFIWFILV